MKPMNRKQRESAKKWVVRIAALLLALIIILSIIIDPNLLTKAINGNN